MTLRLGVLLSGDGSNLQAILEQIQRGTLDAECRLVLSNRPQARGLTRARDAGVKTAVLEHKQFPTREAFDAALVQVLQTHGVEWLALAGFMRVVSPVLLGAFPGQVVNIHPSLLPAFPGVDAQEQAYRHGAKLAGCTVHFVDQGVDSGPIIAQRSVPVGADDTPESLRARILAEEHQLFPEVLQWLAEGRVHVEPRSGARPLVRIDPPGSQR